jgi:hypothetical protein
VNTGLLRQLLLVIAAMALSPAAPCGAALLSDTVTGADCSVTTGGSATGNNTTCNFGLTPEQVKELTEAAVRGATVPLTGTIVELSKRLGVTEDATKTLLRIVGERDVPLERLSEALNRVANDYKRLQTQLAALNSNDPAVRSLVEQAKAKITAGTGSDFKEAHRLLAEATRRQITAAQNARSIQEQARKRRNRI